MDEERDATGNEIPSDGDLAEPESQAPESESRERESEPDWKRKYLEAKQAEEEANRLRRENEDLRRSQQQPPAAVRRDDEDDDDSDEVAALRLLAKGDPARGVPADPVAKAQLRLIDSLRRDREEREELVRGIQLRDQLRDITDKDERDETRKRFDPRKHRDIQHAHDEVRREKQDARIRALEAENARLKAGVPANPNVVRTHTRAVDATEHRARRNETDEQFRARISNMSDEDRRSAMMERRKTHMGT